MTFRTRDGFALLAERMVVDALANVERAFHLTELKRTLSAETFGEVMLQLRRDLVWMTTNDEFNAFSYPNCCEVAGLDYKKGWRYALKAAHCLAHWRRWNRPRRLKPVKKKWVSGKNVLNQRIMDKLETGGVRAVFEMLDFYDNRLELDESGRVWAYGPEIPGELLYWMAGHKDEVVGEIERRSAPGFDIFKEPQQAEMAVAK